jgi:hypothetical protein
MRKNLVIYLVWPYFVAFLLAATSDNWLGHGRLPEKKSIFTVSLGDLESVSYSYAKNNKSFGN